MRGDLGAAEQAFRRALQQAPNNPGVFLNLTRLLQMQKRLQRLVVLLRFLFASTSSNYIYTTVPTIISIVDNDVERVQGG